MSFFHNNYISKKNKHKLNQNYQYLRVMNSFKNQVNLNNVLYNKKHYNIHYYNKIAKSINRLNFFLEYFSFDKEKEKYLSFDFLSSFFVFRGKSNNINLKVKIYDLKNKNLMLLNDNLNLFFFKKRLNKLIYLKKYKRFFTFLFIDDLFFLYFLNYKSLLYLKKLIIFDYLYFYLFKKNINNQKNKKYNIQNSFKLLYSKAKYNIRVQYDSVFFFFRKLNKRLNKDFILSISLRSQFFNNSNFLEAIKSEKKNYYISVLSRLNLKMPKISRFRIKKFVKKFARKRKKFKYFNNRIVKNIKKKLIYSRSNTFFSFINNINSVILNKKKKFKKKTMFKIFNKLLNKKLKIKNSLFLKTKSFKFFNMISKEYFRVNKLILKNFLENIYNLEKLRNNSLRNKQESKYKIILDNYILSYKKFIQNYYKYNFNYFNKLSLNSLKYNKIILSKKKKKTALNLFFYKNKRLRKSGNKEKDIVNSFFNKILRRNFIYINKKKIDFRKFLPIQKTKKEVIQRKKKKISFVKFFTKLYQINRKKNKRNFFFLNKLKENNKISFNFLNLNKFYSNLEFENIFNYRLNIFSNLQESVFGLDTYLNYYPNMYFLIKFTDNLLIPYTYESKVDFLNIIDFFLSFFNFDSLFFFNYKKNNRLPYYYSKSPKPYNLNNSKINLSFSYIYPKIFEYNYLKIKNSNKVKKTYYSNFFTKHRNYYDSNYSIDLLFQNKKESLNNYLLCVYNKLLDNSPYYSSLLREDTDSAMNVNSSYYIWTSMLDKDFEKIDKKKSSNYSFFQKDNQRKINSSNNINENLYITRDYIKFFFAYTKNNIKKSILNTLKLSKDSLDLINLNLKKIESFDPQFIKNKFTFEVFEKSDLYNFFLDIFLKKFDEKQNLKKILNIDIFDFNSVLKLNNKFLNEYFGLFTNKKLNNKSKGFLFNFLNETNYSVNKFTKLNEEDNLKKNSLNSLLNKNLFNDSFFKKWANFKEIFFLKLFFPKLLKYLQKRSFKFSKIRKFKTVKFSNNFFSINNLNKSVLKNRRLIAQSATKIPFNFNIYPIYINNFKRKKTKIYFFRKRSKLRYGQFYFLDLYNSYFKLKDIQLKKFMIENKLSNYFDIDAYIKNLFFAFDLINIKKKDYLSDENNYYYNSSYFSNLIFNKIYVNKLKIFFKDNNFHIISNLDKKIFMDFSVSKLSFNKSLIDFNDSLFFQTNLFKFMHRIKKHSFFFNKYFYKLNKKLSINSLNFYYDFKSKNLNKNYYKFIKKEVLNKNNNYILYQYLTKYSQIKKNSIFVKKFTKRIFGRNSKRFFIFRSFLRHLKNVYNTRGKPGEKKDKIINYLIKGNTANDMFALIKRKLISLRYSFYYKFFFNFIYNYNNKNNIKNNYYLNLDYYNKIYYNKFDLHNLNNFKFNISNKNKDIKLFSNFNYLNYFIQKFKNKFIINNFTKNNLYILFNKNSIDNFILLDFISNRKSYLLYVFLNNLIEKKEILNKYKYLFNNKTRNKYLKDSIISSVKLFSNNLIENPIINSYKINYIKGYLYILIFKNKLINEILLNINKNINKFFNHKYSINNVREVFLNFLNKYLFKLYNNKLEKLIIYKYKFNNIYINIIKNKKNDLNLDVYNIYLAKKINEFFAKLKYISYNLIYKTHEVKNINVFSPLDFSFSVNSFLFNYNSFFELKNSLNYNLKGYSKNFKNIGGVLLFKIGL